MDDSRSSPTPAPQVRALIPSVERRASCPSVEGLLTAVGWTVHDMRMETGWLSQRCLHGRNGHLTLTRGSVGLCLGLQTQSQTVLDLNPSVADF